MDAHGHETQTRRVVRQTTTDRCSESSGGSRGRARGGGRASHPLFLDQTEARRVKKKFFGDRPTLASLSNYDHDHDHDHDFKTTIGLMIKTTALHVRHDS